MGFKPQGERSFFPASLQSVWEEVQLLGKEGEGLAREFPALQSEEMLSLKASVFFFKKK